MSAAQTFVDLIKSHNHCCQVQFVAEGVRIGTKIVNLMEGGFSCILSY